ncbi:MAG: hypothetical protein ABFS56_03920 [Pseudomonadota bacterium]
MITSRDANCDADIPHQYALARQQIAARDGIGSLIGTGKRFDVDAR